MTVSNRQLRSCEVCSNVSVLTTVSEADKAYGVLTLIVFNLVRFRGYTLSPPFLPMLETFCELLFSECLRVSSSNFVWCPPLPQIGVLSEVSYALGIGKSHTVRHLVSTAAVATERCRVWPKTAAQDVKCVRAHCRGAWSSRHPAIFRVVFGELIHANVARPPRRIPCLSVGSVLVVYDTLRIKKRQ